MANKEQRQDSTPDGSVLNPSHHLQKIRTVAYPYVEVLKWTHF